jgi:probable rRNA maturation factor
VTVHVTWAPGADGSDGAPLLDDATVTAAVGAALEHGGRPGIEIEVVFVDDARIVELHGRWLGDDAPTDVISFDLGQDQPGPAGELYVSVDCAVRVAAERGLDPMRELALYVVHGTLHLCGLDDHGDEERARMRAAEAAVLRPLGLAHDEESFE